MVNCVKGVWRTRLGADLYICSLIVLSEGSVIDGIFIITDFRGRLLRSFALICWEPAQGRRTSPVSPIFFRRKILDRLALEAYFFDAIVKRAGPTSWRSSRCYCIAIWYPVTNFRDCPERSFEFLIAHQQGVHVDLRSVQQIFFMCDRGPDIAKNMGVLAWP